LFGFGGTYHETERRESPKRVVEKNIYRRLIFATHRGVRRVAAYPNVVRPSGGRVSDALRNARADDAVNGDRRAVAHPGRDE